MIACSFASFAGADLDLGMIFEGSCCFFDAWGTTGMLAIAIRGGLRFLEGSGDV